MTVLQRTDLTTSQKIQCAVAAVAGQHAHGSKTALSETYEISRPTVCAVGAAAQSVLRSHFEAPLLQGAAVDVRVDDAQLHRAHECRPMPSVSPPAVPAAVHRCRREVGTWSRASALSDSRPAPRPSCRRCRAPLCCAAHAPAPSSDCRVRPPPPWMVPARPPGVRGRLAPRKLRSLGVRASGLHPSPPASKASSNWIFCRLACMSGPSY